MIRTNRRVFVATAGVAAVGWSVAAAAEEVAGAVVESDAAPPEALVERGADFFRTAPHVIVHEAVLPAPPEVVFATLKDPEPWPRWLPLVTSVHYLSPGGVGCERDVVTGGMGRIRERFFRWHEGSRFSFSVIAADTPLLVSFAEDYLLKPVDGGRTRLVWTVAVETRAWAFFAGPATMAAFQATFPSSMERLAAIVQGIDRGR